MQTYTLNIKQTCSPTPGQPHKAPFHLPVAVGLLDAKGQDLPLRLDKETEGIAGTRILELRQEEETFIFNGIPEEPVPSLLRGFSAPVKLHLELSDQERYFLLVHDPDRFNRWEAGQQLAIKILLNLVADYQRGQTLTLASSFVKAFENILRSAEPDQAFVAELLTLPSENYLSEFMPVIDPEAIHEARRFVRHRLAVSLREAFTATYEALTDTGSYRLDPKAIGRRRLRNTCLSYLMALDEAAPRRRGLQQFNEATNMTDTIAALSGLADTDGPERKESLQTFYKKWQDEPLVVDKWFSIQALSTRTDTLEVVKALSQHPAFKLTNPNKVRALIGAFCQGNPARFHGASGEGYRFLGDYVLKLDPLNPQIAARLVNAFSLWRRYDENRQTLMKGQLERIAETPQLSKDVYEIVSKSLF